MQKSFIDLYGYSDNIFFFEYYREDFNNFILIDILNTFLAIILHPFLFPAMFGKNYMLRFSNFSNIIAKSIVSSKTINILNLRKIKEIFISNDHNYFTRQIIKKASAEGIKTIFIPNGQINDSFPLPITDKIFLDNNISKDLCINKFNFSEDKIKIIGYPKLSKSVKKNVEKFNFGFCTTPSMDEKDIVYIIRKLNENNLSFLFRPHPSTFDLIKKNVPFLKDISDPFQEDISLFFSKTEKIITGNSGILFESIFLKKTTFLWAGNVSNKYGKKNEIDRYNVLKKNLCLKLTKDNFLIKIQENHQLNKSEYEELFPVGLQTKVVL